MVVSKHAIHDSLHSLFLIVYANFEVIITAEYGIDDVVFSGFILYGFFDQIHGFLQLFFIITLKHDRRSDGLECGLFGFSCVAF